MRKEIAMGLVVLAACTAKQDNGDIDVDPVSDLIGNWSSTLSPQNNSGISGTATLQSRAAGSKVNVHITGAMNGSVHPWHVHRGTCGNDKGIVGGANEYEALTVGADGTAHGEESIPVGLAEDETYFINIHKSPSDLTTIVACGVLRH